MNKGDEECFFFGGEKHDSLRFVCATMLTEATSGPEIKHCDP